MSLVLSSCIVDHLTALLYEHGAAASTVKQYQAALRHYDRWLKEQGQSSPTLDEFNTITLRRFLYYLQGKSLRPRSVRGYFHALRGFGEYLLEIEKGRGRGDSPPRVRGILAGVVLRW